MLFLAPLDWWGCSLAEPWQNAGWFTPCLGGWFYVSRSWNFEGEEHVASLCLSTWLLSSTHTAHVLPSEWRSSTHTPQDSGRNVYLVCVCERVRNESQEVSVCLNNGWFLCGADGDGGTLLGLLPTTVVVCRVSAILFSHCVIITSEITSDFFKSLISWKGLWVWGVGGHHG